LTSIFTIFVRDEKAAYLNSEFFSQLVVFFLPFMTLNISLFLVVKTEITSGFWTSFTWLLRSGFKLEPISGSGKVA